MSDRQGGPKPETQAESEIHSCCPRCEGTRIGRNILGEYPCDHRIHGLADVLAKRAEAAERRAEYLETQYHPRCSCCKQLKYECVCTTAIPGASCTPESHLRKP